MAEFQVHIRSTGQLFTIPEGQSITKVLAENNIEIPVGCEHGTCGTCMTRYTYGDIEHHDKILTPKEREEYLTPCCSRAKSGKIILDL